jgi:hypothetical protein
VIGFYDGYTLNKETLLEIKFSRSGGWSLGRFKKSPQRKIYGLSDKNFKKAILITGKIVDIVDLEGNVTGTTIEGINVLEVPFTEADRQQAKNYILDAIAKIEAGEFTIPENPNCAMCVYRKSCPKSNYR